MSGRVERALDRRVVGDGQHHRVERAPQDGRVSTSGRQMDDRRPARDRQLHHLAGPAAAARRKPVPYGDQHVAMRDRRPPGHHIGVELAVLVARQLEHAVGPLEQVVVAFTRPVIGQGIAISRAFERDHRLQFPAEIERDFGSDLVGAVGDRRDEAHAGGKGAKQSRSFAKRLPPPRPAAKRFRMHAAVPRRPAAGDVRAVPGDPDAEPNGRRGGRVSTAPPGATPALCFTDRSMTVRCRSHAIVLWLRLRPFAAAGCRWFRKVYAQKDHPANCCRPNHGDRSFQRSKEAGSCCADRGASSRRRRPP